MQLTPLARPQPGLVLRSSSQPTPAALTTPASGAADSSPLAGIQTCADVQFLCYNCLTLTIKFISVAVKQKTMITQRSILRVTGVIIIFLLFVFFVIITRRNFDYSETITINNKASESNPSTGIASTLYVSVSLPSLLDERPISKVVVNSVSLSVKHFQEFDTDQVCFDYIVLFDRDILSPPQQKDNLTVHDRGDPEERCISLQEKSDRVTSYVGFPFGSLELNLLDISYDPFYYPFDSYYGEVLIAEQYSFFNRGKLVKSVMIAPVVNIDIVQDNSWRADIQDLGVVPAPLTEATTDTFRMSIIETQDTASGFSIRLSRPLIYRIVYVLIVLLVIVLIAFISILESTEIFLQIALALFFGIYGLNTILLPQQINHQSVHNFLVLGMYLLLGAVIIDHFVFHLRKKAPLSTTNFAHVKSLPSMDATFSARSQENFSLQEIKEVPSKLRNITARSRESKITKGTKARLIARQRIKKKLRKHG